LLQEYNPDIAKLLREISYCIISDFHGEYKTYSKIVSIRITNTRVSLLQTYGDYWIETLTHKFVYIM